MGIVPEKNRNFWFHTYPYSLAMKIEFFECCKKLKNANKIFFSFFFFFRKSESSSKRLHPCDNTQFNSDKVNCYITHDSTQGIINHYLLSIWFTELERFEKDIKN